MNGEVVLEATVPVLKVVAYISRERDGVRQLLVFRHRDYPEAGLQVPGGTVKQGEEVETALFREIEEETGLPRSSLYLARKLGVYNYHNPYTSRLNERHVYHLALTTPEDTPDNWEWVETGGGELPMSEGYVFQFTWVDLHPEVELAASQGDYLDAVK